MNQTLEAVSLKGNGIEPKVFLFYSRIHWCMQKHDAAEYGYSQVMQKFMLRVDNYIDITRL